MGINLRQCILTYGGVSSTDLGVTVEGFPGSVKPKKDVDTEEVPGRDGSLVYDYGTYRNYTETYTCHWRKNRELLEAENPEEYDRTSDNFSVDYRILPWFWFSGYQKLVDSFHPNHYRLAFVDDPVEVANIMNQLGRADIKFNFKPQWFRDYGDTDITISTNGYTLKNTGMIAKPLITVKGSGNCTISVNTMMVKISSIPATGIVLDSELQDAYSPDKLTNLNHLISIESAQFPVLNYGDNVIAWVGNVLSVTIKPRWWDLL